jgi:pimeloyl-ACP methyl ester carboxylesterase
MNFRSLLLVGASEVFSYGILRFMEHRTITNQRGIIHYWVEGTSEQTIVFTHGATMDHGMFQYQVKHFAKNYQVITWDAPLHGLSRPYRDFSLRHDADDLIQILGAENVAQAHLVGQSMGGYISQIAALTHPSRIRSLTNVDATPIQSSYYSRMDRWLLSITPALLKLYPHGYLSRTIAKEIALDIAAQTYALDVLKTFTTSEIASIMDGVYKGILPYDPDQRIQCPVLIVYGEKDKTGKVREYSDRWAEQESWELKVISNASHNANQDNPVEFNEVLERFLNTVQFPSST